MDELVAAAAQALGTPSEMVLRSARARAQADGSAVEAVLEAWAGGTASPAPSAAVATVAKPADSAPAESTPSDPEPVAEPPPETEPATAAVETALQTAVAVVEPEVDPPEPIEVAPLSDRLRLPGLAGAFVGGIAGIVLSLLSLSQVIDGTGVVGEPLRAAVEVSTVRYFIIIVAASALVGALIGLASHRLPALFDRGAELELSGPSAATAGAVAGALLGLVGGAALLFVTGESIEQLAGDETVIRTFLPIRSSIFFLAFGGAALGSLTALVVQLIGMPRHLDAEVAADSNENKARLVNSVMIPLVAAALILLIVLPFAYLMIEFPSFAPLIAGVISTAILVIAALMGSRPNAKVTKGELAVAAGGIGVLLLIVALLANAWDSGEHHGEEEDHSEEAAAVLVLDVW